MKVAFVLCDFAIALILLDLLRTTGRAEHLVLAYAWNPLLAIEVAGSGHIDIVGALLLLISVAALARRWRTIAAVAFGLAVAVKFLPIVLLPLYWKRIRIRDAGLVVVLVALLYLPFLNHGRIPFGSLGTYVNSFRFNGPVFAILDHVAPPQLLVGLALIVGLATAAWLRRASPNFSPDKFAWPMAASLICAPARIPLVSSLAGAIFDVGLDAADYRLDGEHYSGLYPMARTRAHWRVGTASWLGNVAGIWMGGCSWCSHHLPAYDSTAGGEQRRVA